MAPSPETTRGKSCLISTSTGVLKRLRRKKQASAEKAVTKEALQGEWTAPAPEFTAAQPEVTDWSEGAGALCDCSAVPY